MDKDAIVTIRINAELKKEVKQIAKRLGVSMSFMLDHFLRHIANDDPAGKCNLDCILQSKSEVK